MLDLVLALTIQEMKWLTGVNGLHQELCNEEWFNEFVVCLGEREKEASPTTRPWSYPGSALPLSGGPTGRQSTAMELKLDAACSLLSVL